jgi:hypothetical protein
MTTSYALGLSLDAGASDLHLAGERWHPKISATVGSVPV